MGENVYVDDPAKMPEIEICRVTENLDVIKCTDDL